MRPRTPYHISDTKLGMCARELAHGVPRPMAPKEPVREAVQRRRAEGERLLGEGEGGTDVGRGEWGERSRFGGSGGGVERRGEGEDRGDVGETRDEHVFFGAAGAAVCDGWRGVWVVERVEEGVQV